MHSSRMRTGRSYAGVCFSGGVCSGGCLLWGCLLQGVCSQGVSAPGVSALGGVCSWGVCSRGGVSAPGGVCLLPGESASVPSGIPPPPPHPCEQNDKQVQKYYLGHNFVAAGNNSDVPDLLLIYILPHCFTGVLSPTVKPEEV